MCFMFFYQCCFVYISNGVTDFLLAMIDDVITGGRSLMLRFLPGPVETGPEVNASYVLVEKECVVCKYYVWGCFRVSCVKSGKSGS